MLFAVGLLAWLQMFHAYLEERRAMTHAERKEKFMLAGMGHEKPWVD